MQYQQQQAYGAKQAPMMQADAREKFIVRTYNHLFGAIVLFAAIEVGLFMSGIADQIAMAIAEQFIFVLGAFLIVSWGASHVAHRAASKTTQYAALFAFVLFEAIIFVPMLWIANEFAPGVIQSAAMVTMVGFAGLTGIAFYTRKDFSFLRSLLMWGFFAALLAIAASFLFGFHLGTWFSVAMIAFAGGAILYDTSNILHHYPEDRYVGAALQLFASVALLFWYVLRIFLSRD